MNNLMEKTLGKVPQFLVWLIFTAVICGISMLTAFQPVWANIPFNVIIPILLLIFVPMVFFEKLKLSTLVIMRGMIVLAIFSIIPRDIYLYIVLGFLIINILEATLTDFKRKKIFNGISGLILAASVIIMFKASRWDTLDNLYEMNAVLVAGTICWAIAYTIWNWIFVTNEFSPSISYLHIGILASPIISCIITLNPGYWLIFRANSLTFGGVLQIANKSFLEKKLDNKGMVKFVAASQKTVCQIICMVVNILLIGVSVLVFFL